MGYGFEAADLVQFKDRQKQPVVCQLTSCCATMTAAVRYQNEFLFPYALPEPTTGDTLFTYLGTCSRMGSANPLKDPTMFQRFKDFVKEMLKELFPYTIQMGDVKDFEGWLAGTPYTGVRKNQIIRAFNDRGHYIVAYKDPANPWHASDEQVCYCFVKKEMYTSFKVPRTISSRIDLFKVFFGPLQAAAAQLMKKLPYFMKGIPVKEWLDEISGLYVPGFHSSEGDGTAFESVFDPEFMDATDGETLRHLFRGDPENLAKAEHIMSVLTGVNKLFFKKLNMILHIVGRKMSGEMNTSDSNAMAMLFLALFFHREIQKRTEELLARFEGDDSGKNTPYSVTGETDVYAKLGVRFKSITAPSLSEVKFCGLTFDQATRILVVDPTRLIRLFWLPAEFSKMRPSKRLAYIKVKALSYADLYSGVPIVSAAIEMVLRLTRHIDMRSMTKHVQALPWRADVVSIIDEFSEKGAVDQLLVKLKKARPTAAVRCFYEHIHSVAHSLQRAAEDHFHSINQFGNIDHWSLSIIYEGDQAIRITSALYVTDQPESWQPPALGPRGRDLREWCRESIAQNAPSARSQFKNAMYLSQSVSRPAG
jgi:hypothetical protein